MTTIQGVNPLSMILAKTAIGILVSVGALVGIIAYCINYGSTLSLENSVSKVNPCGKDVLKLLLKTTCVFNIKLF
jgi:hypothetical protein